MPSPTWEDYLAFAEALAAAAAQEILPHFRTRLAVDNKLDRGFDPVTEADRAGERAMRAMIEARFPDHGIIGEEYGVKEGRSPFSWILDPVDGTRSFVFGMTTWTTLIALAHEGKPIVGLMHQPYVGESFMGSPAGSLHRRHGKTMPLSVNPAPAVDQALGSTTGPHLYCSERQKRGLAAMQAGLKAIRYDADAYFFCLLAAGQIDISMDAGLAPYDIAPLIPIIEGAGGIVTTWDGGSAASGGDILAAASPGLHAEAMTLLAG